MKRDQRLHLRLSREELDQLNDISKVAKISMSKVVREAVKEFGERRKETCKDD